MTWPAPPGGGQRPGSPDPRRPAAASEPTAEQAPLSDTVERMLRPQGLFQNQQPPPVGWQQPSYPPAPGGAYPPGGQRPDGGQYPGTGYLSAPPQPWPQAPAGAPPAPTGVLPPAPPSGAGGGYQPGGGYPPAPAGGYQGPYANGQYGQGQYGQEQYGQGQYGGGQYGGGQYGQGPFPPGAQYGPDGTLPGGDGVRQRGGLPFRRSKGLVIALAAAGSLVVIVIVVVALLLSGKPSTSVTANASGPASGSPAATSSASAMAKTQHQAAAALSGLLSQSGGDRAEVGAAYTSVSTCGKNLAKDAAVFRKAAGNRRTLLARLATLPGRAALSRQMLTDLTDAWQASATVDGDLAKWATDEAGHCTKKQVLKDRNYVAATGAPNNEATNNKNAFVELWNPLARKNGLPKVQPSQI